MKNNLLLALFSFATLFFMGESFSVKTTSLTDTDNSKKLVRTNTVYDDGNLAKKVYGDGLDLSNLPVYSSKGFAPDSGTVMNTNHGLKRIPFNNDGYYEIPANDIKDSSGSGSNAIYLTPNSETNSQPKTHGTTSGIHALSRSSSSLSSSGKETLRDKSSESSSNLKKLARKDTEYTNFGLLNENPAQSNSGHGQNPVVESSSNNEYDAMPAKASSDKKVLLSGSFSLKDDSKDSSASASTSRFKSGSSSSKNVSSKKSSSYARSRSGSSSSSSGQKNSIHYWSGSESSVSNGRSSASSSSSDSEIPPLNNISNANNQQQQNPACSNNKIIDEISEVYDKLSEKDQEDFVAYLCKDDSEAPGARNQLIGWIKILSYEHAMQTKNDFLRQYDLWKRERLANGGVNQQAQNRSSSANSQRSSSQSEISVSLGGNIEISSGGGSDSSEEDLLQAPARRNNNVNVNNQQQQNQPAQNNNHAVNNQLQQDQQAAIDEIRNAYDRLSDASKDDFNDYIRRNHNTLLPEALIAYINNNGADWVLKKIDFLLQVEGFLKRKYISGLLRQIEDAREIQGINYNYDYNAIRVAVDNMCADQNVPEQRIEEQLSASTSTLLKLNGLKCRLDRAKWFLDTYEINETPELQVVRTTIDDLLKNQVTDEQVDVVIGPRVAQYEENADEIFTKLNVDKLFEVIEPLKNPEKFIQDSNVIIQMIQRKEDIAVSLGELKKKVEKELREQAKVINNPVRSSVHVKQDDLVKAYTSYESIDEQQLFKDFAKNPNLAAKVQKKRMEEDQAHAATGVTKDVGVNSVKDDDVQVKNEIDKKVQQVTTIVPKFVTQAAKAVATPEGATVGAVLGIVGSRALLHSIKNGNAPQKEQLCMNGLTNALQALQHGQIDRAKQIVRLTPLLNVQAKNQLQSFIDQGQVNQFVTFVEQTDMHLRNSQAKKAKKFRLFGVFGKRSAAAA